MRCGIDVLAKTFRCLGYASDHRTRLAIPEAVLTVNERTGRRRMGIAPVTIDRVLDSIRDGRKLNSIFFVSLHPHCRNVLRYQAKNSQHEEQTSRAQRLGVCPQRGGLVDGFLAAEPKDLAMIKELTNHIRGWRENSRSCRRLAQMCPSGT